MDSADRQIRTLAPWLDSESVHLDDRLVEAVDGHREDRVSNQLLCDALDQVCGPGGGLVEGPSAARRGPDASAALPRGRPCKPQYGLILVPCPRETTPTRKTPSPPMEIGIS